VGAAGVGKNQLARAILSAETAFNIRVLVAIFMCSISIFAYCLLSPDAVRWHNDCCGDVTVCMSRYVAVCMSVTLMYCAQTTEAEIVALF